MAVSGWGHRAGLAAVTLAATTLASATLLVAPAPVVAAPAATAGPPRPAAALSRAKLVRLGSPPVLPAGAKTTKAGVGPETSLHLDIVLKSRNPTGLDAFDSSVASPGSGDYHAYLSAGAFATRYGPTTASVKAVSAILTSDGLSPGPAQANGLTIPVTTTVARASDVFATSIRNYTLSNGSRVYANTVAPSVPASISGDVTAVVGLDDLSTFAPDPIVFPKPKGPPPRSGSFETPAGPQPCAGARAAASEYGSYTINQLANAYGFTGLYKDRDLGAGQTVALDETDSFSMSDLDVYATCFGLRTAAVNRQVRIVDVDGGAGSGPGALEAALDVEVVLGLAPDAHIEVYEGANNSVSGLDALNRIVSTDTAQVVSFSYGLCEEEAEGGEPGLLEAEDAIFEQAAAQGQTVLAASGDNGSEACSSASPRLGSFTSVNDPASQPFVTGVGGTDMTALGSSPSDPPSEVGWNESGAQIGASGGGFSSLWPEPEWQQALVQEDPSIALCGPAADLACRGVPDVSASADPNHGYTVYFDGAWLGVGGTSGSTPLWAALVALTNATSVCDGVPVGYLNPRLYQLGDAQYLHTGAGTAPRYFNDITSGDNDFTGLTNVYSAEPGWDPVSGLGSPVLTNGAGAGGGLAAGLCESVAVARPPGATSPGVSRISPPAGPDTGGTTLTITGTNLAGASAVSFGSVVASGKAILTKGATSITVTAPPAFLAPDTGAPEDGSVQVTVTTPAGTSAPSSRSTFTYQGKRPVLSYMTVAGAESGGTLVDLEGSGFTSASKVAFGKDRLARHAGSGRSCRPSETGFCVIDDNTISLVSPPASRAGVGAGAVAVVVGTPEGATVSGVAITPNEEFYYAPAPKVTRVGPPGPPAGGYTVIVDGTGFAAYCSYASPEPTLSLCVDTPYGTPLVSGIDVVVGGHSTQVAGDLVNVLSDSELSFTMPSEPGHGHGSAIAKVEVATLAGRASGRFDYSLLGRPAPTLASMTPNVGTTNGETPVEITGTNFEPGMTVTFGGTPSNDILSVNSAGTAATVLSPGGTAGLAPVDVTTPWGTTSISDSAIAPNQFTYVVTSTSVATVLSVTSDAGPTKGGTRVSITGSGFFAGGASSGVSAIRFGGVAASHVACSLDTACQATVPPHAAGPVPVTVTTGYGSEAATSPASGGYDRFTYTRGPGITAVSPDRGPMAGGTLVTITGFGFDRASKVSFGGVAAGSVSCPSSTVCKAVTPTNSPGTVGVVVTGPTGTSPNGPGTAANQFTYLAPTVTNVAPDQGPTSGGTLVTITGSGLTGASAVSFGKLGAISFSCISDTTCTAVSPADPSAPTDRMGQVDVRVTARGVKSIPTGLDTFTYVVVG